MFMSFVLTKCITEIESAEEAVLVGIKMNALSHLGNQNGRTPDILA